VLRGFALFVALVFVAGPARGGPPFVTDDPEPIDHYHWELYVGSQTAHFARGWEGTAPLLEANYGVVPDVQLHVIAPFAFSAPTDGSAHYGFGDMELGSKIRFVHEGDWVPQIGTYPMFEAPTGAKRHELGNGTAQLFLPLWLQKSFGQWTTYGGPGFWIDLGDTRRNWWFFGWELQRRLADFLSLGTEVFWLTPKASGEAQDVRFNLGAIVDASKTHHILLSAGRSILGPNSFQSYVAWLVTLGPAKE
jgi:hypothetical protein